MKVIGKSIKIVDGFIQIAKIIDNFETEKIQLKYFGKGNKGEHRSFIKPQSIYFNPTHWEMFKEEIREKAK